MLRCAITASRYRTNAAPTHYPKGWFLRQSRTLVYFFEGFIWLLRKFAQALYVLSCMFYLAPFVYSDDLIRVILLIAFL